MPSVVDSLVAILTGGLWPVGYTLIGVFAGLYLDELIKGERDRTQKIFRPLIQETWKVKQGVQTEPIQEFREEGGEYESVLLEIDSMDLIKLDSDLFEAIEAYIDRIQNLGRVHQKHVPLAEVFVKVGYDEHLKEILPSSLIADGSEGIDPSGRPAFPGPSLLVGTYITDDGHSHYFDSGYRAAVQTHRRYPLFAFLLENFESLRATNGPDDIRQICRDSTEIDVEYMDAQHAGWAVQIWEALNASFESRQSMHEELGIGTIGGEESASSPMVIGDSFVEIVRGSEMATRFIQYQARQEVIDAADEIHEKLVRRTSMHIVDPRRWWASSSRKSGGTAADSEIA